MADKYTDELKEHITHQTEFRPFSIHHINIPIYMELVLYLHCHTEMEIFYLEQGEVTFHIEDTFYRLNAGDAIFIPPNLLHSAKRYGAVDAACSFYAIVFSQEMLMDITPSYCEHYIHPVTYNATSCIVPIYHEKVWQKQILSLLSFIFSQNGKDIDNCELMIRGSLLIIWQNLYNNCLSQVLNSNSTDNSLQIKKALDYINSNYMENLSLEDLARYAGLSEGHFCRLFKTFTGYTPFSFLNKKRISRSCEYLTQTNKKIAEIAVLCGYNNISYYNRAFIKIIKESPSSYRKHFSSYDDRI